MSDTPTHDQNPVVPQRVRGDQSKGSPDQRNREAEHQEPPNNRSTTEKAPGTHMKRHKRRASKGSRDPCSRDESISRGECKLAQVGRRCGERYPFRGPNPVDTLKERGGEC
ncbi:hypothetical protein NDU88_002162 [Pleurodeles waltl]|uniref:Uncharacterized protein n=1 Tax=Pleurodeles waltl TaxID=8319 RepID=A0AAV7TKZ8_PLEWA|nr:hypothetical protein NDU88_002162 [Pleurodeles waltl]